MQAHKEKLGPLHGLPVAHKDLLETRGIRTTFGSPLYKDYIPAEDDIVVERMRRAGAITIGKTNTPEFGAGSQTFNKVFGATRNPYDLTKTCGGSSGGAAVALACGLVPVANGSDTGGSLRNPAAFCNVVGFRPSIGRVPNPKAAFAWLTLSTSGCLGRSVADLAFVAEHASRDPIPARRSPSTNRENASRARSTAVSKACAWPGSRTWAACPSTRACAPWWMGIARHLNRWGASSSRRSRTSPPPRSPFACCAHGIRRILMARGCSEHPDAFKDTLKGEIEEGLRLTGMDVARAETAHGQLWRRFQAFLEKYEYFVLPTTQLPPFDVNTPYPTEIAGVKFENYIDWMKSCWYISATGNPAASVPARLYA